MKEAGCTRKGDQGRASSASCRGLLRRGVRHLPFTILSSSALACCLIFQVVTGCSSSSGPAVPDDAWPEGDASVAHDAATTDDSGLVDAGCPRVARPADRARKVVVSHPFDTEGKDAKGFEVLELSATGDLARTNQVFEMGTALDAEIAFTPDGQVGLVPQRDGSIGVFAFDEAGAPRVLYAAFTGSFFASQIVVSADGARAFVVDSNRAANGGGVHELAIGCDGTLSYVGLHAPGDLVRAMALVPTAPTRALLAANQVAGSKDGDTAHLIDVGAGAAKVLAGGSAFPDAVASSVAVTPDGTWALLTDTTLDVGDRIVGLALDGMKATTPIQVVDPTWVTMSPFGNAALVLSTLGDALVHVKYDPANVVTPFTVIGEVSYSGARPQLPAAAVVIDRGSLRGRVLVGETSAVRQLGFAADGTLTDLGKPLAFDGLAGIVGAVGIQP